MPFPDKTQAAGTIAAILICAAATDAGAQSGQVLNEQVQLGDVFSTQMLNVEEASDGVGAAATSVGNIVSAIGGPVSFNVQSDQALAGHVESSLSATVAGASGPYFSTAVDATGNSATLGACCAATTGSSLQAVEPGGVVAADAYGRTGGWAGSVAVDASAVGNTTGWEQNGGSVEAWTGQTNAGLTTSSNSGDFASVPGNAGFTATSVGNNVTGDITNAAVDLGVGQDLGGDGVRASIDVSLGEAGDLQALSSGVGNNVDIQAQGPQTDVNIQQSTSAGVNAYTNVNAGYWSGDANAIAYGVGNSAVVSNSGPKMGLWTDQTQNGDVDIAASFTGGTGSTVFASSTAMGNAVSAYPCQTCGGEFTATNRQVSAGRVRSNTAVSVYGSARSVAAESVAIGNSATYQVFGNGN